MSKYLKVAIGAAGVTCGLLFCYQHGFPSGHHLSFIGAFLFLLGGIVFLDNVSKNDPS